MTLSDQLDELRKVILRDRSDLVSGDSDSLWEDATLLRYIEDGERRFARETMVLRDGTTSRFSRLTLRAGVRDYPLPAEVFAVLSARHPDREYDLKRSGHMLVQARDADTSLTFDPAESSTVAPGAPLGFYTDETSVYARQSVVTVSIFPLPDADAAGTVLTLRTIRIPCTEYTLDDLERESEIPADYQLDVLEWAAYRAKRSNDADIGTTPNADKHKEEFEASIARCKKAMRVRTRAATGIRFGGNGFSWSR